MAPVLSAHPQVMATLVLLLSVLSLAAGGKLLVVPVDGSHWLSMREVLDALSQNGHEIVVVAPEINLHIKPRKNFFIKMYPVPSTQVELHGNFQACSEYVVEEASFVERVVKSYEWSKKALLTCTSLPVHTYCPTKSFSDILRKESLMPSLQTLCYPAGRWCLSIFQSLPFFFLYKILCGLESEATQCPNLPSYVPRAFTEHTDRMNFLQRVKNLIFDIPNYFLCDFVIQPYAKLASEFLQQDVTVADLLRKASIWLL